MCLLRFKKLPFNKVRDKAILKSVISLLCHVSLGCWGPHLAQVDLPEPPQPCSFSSQGDQLLPSRMEGGLGVTGLTVYSYVFVAAFFSVILPLKARLCFRKSATF